MTTAREMTHSPYKELVRSLFKTTKQVDAALLPLQETATKIKTKYKPRVEFERWRDSQEGKLWKRKQYQVQGGCCAICSKPIQLKGSHIDHIKGLARYPHLALDTGNLRITCPDCNIPRQGKPPGSCASPRSFE